MLVVWLPLSKCWLQNKQGVFTNLQSDNELCETLRVVSDWVANAAARNEHDVMEFDVLISKNRGIRLPLEREC